MEREMALEANHGNRASSEFDMGCTETLRIPAVTSVSFYICDSVLQDSLESHQANQGTLRV